jgi:hypothetical protein
MPLPLILALLLALPPAAASARIYKWVDENGTTVYSNVPPTDGDALKTAKVVIEDEDRFKPTADQAAQAEVLRRQQEILERLYALERQVSARRYASPPPPPPDYYAGYYQPSYYPPSYYAAPYYPFVPSYIVSRPFFVPAHRFIAPRPGFVSIHRSSVRRIR